MARTKGKGRPRYLHLHLPLQRMETEKKLHQESLFDSNMKNGSPCMDVVVAGDTPGNILEASKGMEPLSFLLPCSITPSLSSSRTVSILKSKRRTPSYNLNKKKLEALSNHFNPIPFLREKPSSFTDHRNLLVRLGLWNFLHLDELGQDIHSEMIKQLIVHYNPKKPANRRTHVNGCAILVNRAALARALSLPAKKLGFNESYIAANAMGPLVVSDEEAAFLDELVCSWLVLQDDDCELPDEVLKVKFLIREKRFEDVDWAGLIWFMMRSELIKGADLVNCHYASHMQVLLKNQKPQFFVDQVEIYGLLCNEAGFSDGANLDHSLPESELVEGWEKHRILDVGDKSSSEWKQDSAQEGSPSCKRNGSNELVVVYEPQEPQNTVTQSPGDIDVGLNIAKRLGQDDHNMVGEVSGENSSSTYQQSALQKEDENEKLKLLAVDDGKDDEIKWTAKDLFVRDYGEFPDNLENKLTVDSQCNKKRQFENNLTDQEFGSPSNMLMNENYCDKKLKMECSGDLTANGMHVLSNLESQFEQMELDSGHDNGEKELALDDDLVENCRTINDKICTSNELKATEMENDNNEEQKLIPDDEDKRNVSNDSANAVLPATNVEGKNTELLSLNARKLQEGLGKEEIFDKRTDNLIDSQEKEEVCFILGTSTMDGDNQQTKTAMKDDEKPEETSVLNDDIPGTELQNKNRFIIKSSSSFVEPFVVQEETKFENFEYSPLDKSLKREIDNLNDREFGYHQQNMTNYSAAADYQSFDLNCCTEQVELWMSRLKNAANMNDNKNTVLLEELETKNLMIQQLQRRCQEEQYRYKKRIHWLEREVYLMGNILDDYRAALNEVNRSFAEYRSRVRLSDEDEPIYVDHPDGGGEVILATELISSNLKQGSENP